MTLSETGKIDIAAEDPDGNVVFGIVVAEGWNDPAAQREQLASKLSTYLSYLHTPEYRDRFGSRDATVYVVTDSEPPPEIAGLLRATEEASGVPIRVQKLDSGAGPGTAERPRGLPKDVPVEPVARRPPAQPPSTSSAPASSTSVQRIRATFALLGLALAVAAGVVAWARIGSIALALFVFLMVNYIVSRGVADLVTDAQKVRRGLYFLLVPASSTALLVLAWRWWEIMWLAVVLGIVGGVAIHALLAPRLFPRIHREEERDTAERMKQAVARKRAAGERS